MINKQKNIGKSVAFIFSVLTAIIYTVSETTIRFLYPKGLGLGFDAFIMFSCAIIFFITIHIQIKKYPEASLISAFILALLNFVGERLSAHFHGDIGGVNLSISIHCLLFFFYFLASLLIGLPFDYFRKQMDNST